MSKIGIFDSGIGGLSVLNQIFKKFPNNEFYYLADEAYYPYGVKTEEQIVDRSLKITRFLISLNVDLIIIACNTVNSTAYETLKKSFNIPIIGVIDGAVNKALKITKNNMIGVISTPLTKKTGIYRKKIKEMESNIKVFEIGSQELVDVVENGKIDDHPTFILANRLLEKINFIDTLILGCTHFPALEEIIKKILPNVCIVDPAIELVDYLKDFIDNKNLSSLTFLTTGNVEHFKIKAKIFLKNVTIKPKKIVL